MSPLFPLDIDFEAQETRSPSPTPRPKEVIKPAGIPAYRRRLFRPQTAPCRRAPTSAEVSLNMRRVKLFVFKWQRRTKENSL